MFLQEIFGAEYRPPRPIFTGGPGCLGIVEATRAELRGGAEKETQDLARRKSVQAEGVGSAWT